MVCLPFGLGSVLKLLDCVIISAYTTANICTVITVRVLQYEMLIYFSKIKKLKDLAEVGAGHT